MVDSDKVEVAVVTMEVDVSTVVEGTVGSVFRTQNLRLLGVFKMFQTPILTFTRCGRRRCTCLS